MYIAFSEVVKNLHNKISSEQKASSSPANGSKNAKRIPTGHTMLLRRYVATTSCAQ